jgi:hypothetical protein
MTEGGNKMGEYEMNTISINDVVEACKKFDGGSDAANETVLSFVSELTGLSVDRILELME